MYTFQTPTELCNNHIIGFLANFDLIHLSEILLMVLVSVSSLMSKFIYLSLITEHVSSNSYRSVRIT